MDTVSSLLSTIRLIVNIDSVLHRFSKHPVEFIRLLDEPVTIVTPFTIKKSPTSRPSNAASQADVVAVIVAY